MKKIFLLTASVLVLASCGNQKKEEKAIEQTEIANEEVEEHDPTILLGMQERSILETEPYSEWFNQNYEYIPDAEAVKVLTASLKDVSIIAFMGTWCEDSQMHVPAFYKILDEAKFNPENIKMITVSRKKDTPQNLEKGFNIEYVPTFILYRNKKEIGRIVESPVETLEADLLAISKGEEYKHTYAE